MRRRLYLVDSFLKFLYHLVVFNFLKLLYNMVVLNFLQPGRFPKATYMALNVEQQLQVDFKCRLVFLLKVLKDVKEGIIWLKLQEELNSRF